MNNSAALEVTNDPLSQPVESIKGVGVRLGRHLRAKGLNTVEDLLFNLPLGYLDRRGGRPIGRLRPGEYASFEATVISAGEVNYRRRRVFEVLVGDDTGVVTAKWFRYGPWLERRLRQLGKRVRVSGVLRQFGGRLEIHHPDLEVAGKGEAAIVPRYGSIPGVAPKAYRRIIEQVLQQFVPQIEETLPEPVRRYFDLVDLQTALRLTHAPPTMPVASDQGSVAPGLRRLIFEELFFMELHILRSRREWKAEAGVVMEVDRRLFQRVGRLLPFRLTAAQKRVMREIAADLASGRPMNRLLQGDVGCGKTVVALLAALIAVSNGYQVAVMAPTEILAQQHYQNMRPVATALGIPLTLLTSKVKPREKQERGLAVATGEAKLVIGTHALIQEGISFQRLGLVIIDEQHRFGVLQRLALRRKGRCPHVLVMTATPIPRTLAMTLYGDLEMSVIDELPPGRSPVDTRIYGASERGRAYDLIRNELRQGRRAYVIYPLVEESEKSDLQDATTMAEHLQAEVFPEFKVGMIHGRLPSEEKAKVMAAFATGEVQLLVATTVIEVGIDVPEATVMVIEHPERFGLAQLHQLRGRVGRGRGQSYCILIAGEDCGREARERLAVMEQSSDGFRIAEEDMRLRGPGELLGVRQAGIADLRLANLVRDASILVEARKAALALMAKDPELEKPAHHPIKVKLERQSRQAQELLKTS